MRRLLMLTFVGLTLPVLATSGMAQQDRVPPPVIYSTSAPSLPPGMRVVDVANVSPNGISAWLGQKIIIRLWNHPFEKHYWFLVPASAVRQLGPTKPFRVRYEGPAPSGVGFETGEHMTVEMKQLGTHEMVFEFIDGRTGLRNPMVSPYKIRVNIRERPAPTPGATPVPKG